MFLLILKPILILNSALRISFDMEILIIAFLIAFSLNVRTCTMLEMGSLFTPRLLYNINSWLQFLYIGVN